MAEDIVPFTEAGRLTGARLANFRNDSDEPLASHKQWLETFFVPAMAKHPGARVRVIGMASRNGNPNHNMNLSTRRINKTVAFILSKGKVNIVEKTPRGEIPPAEDGIADGNRDGFWRAVLLKWEGLADPVPIPPSPGPAPGPTPSKKADLGEWWITGVDTFGIPIKAGVAAGKIAVTLLNDQGEEFVISGFGAGVGEGVEFGVDQFNKVLAKLAEIGLKAGDIPNISDKLKKMSFPSATTGFLLKRGSILSGYTIEQITASRNMTVTSAAASSVAGGEIGLITFFQSFAIDPIQTAMMFGRILAGQPWGVYGSVGTGKVALEIGIMSYAITGVEKHAASA